MSKVIIYPNDRGGIAIVYPAPNCGLSIEEIARKDVPAGLPHLILDETDVPTDHTFFEAFEADFSEPHGHGAGAQAWFIEQYEAEIAEVTEAQAPEAPVAGIAAPIDLVIFPNELDTPEKQQVAYDAYVARVAAENDAQAKAYQDALANWETIKATRIAHLNTMINVQRQELAQLNGAAA
jgi:hypothetical protein